MILDLTNMGLGGLKLLVNQPLKTIVTTVLCHPIYVKD